MKKILNFSNSFADGELYAGTVADFSATDPLILKQKLRTEQYDLKHLNEPHFVSSLEDEDHVYFFFRESAVEFMNCGKVSLFEPAFSFHTRAVSSSKMLLKDE